jgi:hypothetical protein
MYCPTCGIETNHGLNYCKACGASLTGRSDTLVRRSLSAREIMLFLVIAALGMIGPLGLFIDADDMTRMARAPASITTIMAGCGALLAFLTVLVLAWLFLRLTSSSNAPQVEVRSRDKVLLPGPQSVSQLKRGEQSIPSVTEHTTRSFEDSLRSDQTR